VDIVIDEIANYLPADGWATTPRWLRKTFAQYRHRGLRIFANTQDYMAVDINFRRMVKVAYKVTKVFGSRDLSATLPDPRWIWGVIMKLQFDPDAIEGQGVHSDTLQNEAKILWFHVPIFFSIKPRLVDMYDTTQDIPEYMPNTLEELVMKCEEPDCKDPERDGSPHMKVIHRPV